jgi:hypothetical protein
MVHLSPDSILTTAILAHRRFAFCRFFVRRLFGDSFSCVLSQRFKASDGLGLNFSFSRYV